MKVTDAMTPRSALVTVELPGSRDDALEYLQEREFSSVPVIKNENGTETFRGLVSREGLIENPDEDQLALLLEEVPTTTEETSIEELAGLMLRKSARRVPVVDGRLEGIVTITDVIRAIANGEVAGDAEIGDLAARHINSVYAGTPLPVAERELHYADEPYAIVLDEEADTCGILTAVDVIEVAKVVEGEERTGDSMASDDDDWKWESIKAVGSRYLPTRNVEIPTAPVEEFMTEDVVTVTKQRTAQEAAQLMIRHDIEQLPMMAGDELVGIVQDTHLLEALDER
ncbi:CBS domain-containing protein [Halalkalicoccus jeotgali]|uniref:CBS domain containing protein n=1 Tax=Halalkalicoccus jeotgali (strain DSM 18796 / CECT 7217 / JCM 14584 / KCTC 4019 / B3) TaxID=795797 RepID=D8J4F3_HALJB|nr:CBS domain-containing protein [Halalkalicoccus jeotgali]ADJ13515.1 CBS domain containing protein [Halalkalicoccus jeotgali B3]ELY33010.1 CBS domain containing protein [Halalkalicoccus jeotgali B3]